jgi:rRNA-processing protein FCF1
MNYSDENKASSLAKLLSGYDLVMLDTCSLMEDCFPEWLDILSEAKDYLEPGFTLVVPKACVSELTKHTFSRDVDRKITAKRTLKILKKAKHERLLSIDKKNYNQNFADNAIYAQASADRITLKILVITQDKKLATDLRNLNKLNSQHGKNVSVYKVVPGGKLEYNQGETFQKSTFSQSKRVFAPKSTKPMVSNGQKPAPSIGELSVEAKAQQKDRQLNANLKNPNYPVSTKIADIEAQLELLKKIPEGKLASLHLLQGSKKLQDSLSLLKGKSEAPKKAEPAIKPAIKEVAASEKKEPAPIKIEPKAKEAPAKSEAPKKLWYGAGRTLPFALNMVAEHYGLMFRDPSIAYVPLVHGKLDLTSLDEERILAKLTDGLSSSPKTEFPYSSFRVGGEKGKGEFKVYLDLEPAASSPKSLPTEPAKKTSVSETKEKEERKPEPKQIKKKVAKEVKKPAESKDISSPDVSAVPNSSAAVPSGVNLVVGIPSDERKKGYIERSARREANKGEAKAQGKAKETKKSHEAKPETISKPAPSPKMKAKAEPKKPEPKKETKNSSKVKPETKKASGAPIKEGKATKPASKKPEPKKKVPMGLDAALKSEKSLQANIHNPNYPLESKKKDLQSQIALVKKLSKEEKAKLSLNEQALAMMLSLL